MRRRSLVVFVFTMTRQDGLRTAAIEHLSGAEGIQETSGAGSSYGQSLSLPRSL